eukprot:gene30936-53166_t
MRHWDEVLPGRVLGVQYEDVVADLETQVRRLLDHCGLPFEQACVDFHQTERAVRTASSEQVRQPIFQGGLDQWQNYETWLDPLKAALVTTATAVAPDQAPSTIERWYVLAIMCLAYAINIADRYVVTTVMEPMRLELNLTDSGIAFLTGIPLAVFYVTLGIPISWLADRTNRRNILAAALVVWSGMTALCGLSQTYLQFLLARIGVGIGEAGGTPPANSIIADNFPA